jgi:hypothetical protein
MDYFVFLGGSCNPTTWRQVKAIPYLEQHGISYFNPQVDDWNEEFAVKENQAKENAKINFFVIENQTNGTMSLVEICYLIGRGKTIIIAMDNEPHSFYEINKAREYIIEIVSKVKRFKTYIYYQNIEDAISISLSTIYRKSKKTNTLFDSGLLKSTEITKDYKNSEDISTDKEELVDLCKLAFYLGQCKRAGVPSEIQKVKLLNNESTELQGKSINYIKDMNRPRHFINSLV